MKKNVPGHVDNVAASASSTSTPAGHGSTDEWSARERRNEQCDRYHAHGARPAP
jgi:hypothetical protein